MSVLPDGPGRVVIRGVRSDPLTTPTTHRPTGLPPVELTRWELGIDEYAAKVCVSLANVPGVTVAGVPGAGKTSGVNKFVCDFAPSPSVQIVTADGKVSRASEGDYADLVKRMFAFCGDDLDEANALFKRLVELRKRRSATIHSMLKSALEHAVREEEIPRNVARNVRTGTPRPRRFEPLTADEGRQLLTTAQGHPLHALFELALHTGLRKGELLGLRWEDLDLDAGTAAIRRTLQRTSAGGLTTLPTKTRASERRIALPASCAESLQLHHEQQQRESEAAGSAWQHKGHVFTTVQGGPIDPTNLTRAFTTLLRKAGLRRIRFHDLRHSTATLLLEQGVELVVIKELLGHAHIGVTASVYAHVRLRLQRDAIDLLGYALRNPEETTGQPDDGDDDLPLCAAHVR
ncbi:tyrosine-type recombinase/integrase [Streptomyces sp. NPDC030920]|uniref:tyrosine-type recombinase/integrase n=1 Tax=Streptomyces sp. NPDC030920 TaxID=3365308 RepID=UPI0038505992